MFFSISSPTLRGEACAGLKLAGDGVANALMQELDL